MTEPNLPPHSQLDCKNLTSLHSLTCSSLESAYQALYTEFLAKSRHNDIPDSPAARDKLCAVIAQTRSDLATCSESTTRSRISRVLKLQESMLAPIRILPSDVLIDIFQLVDQASGITYLRPSGSIYGCIFLVTWICFWWRDEALSHPAFWSRITIHYGYGQPHPEVTAFLSECILRSGDSVPMNISISSVGGGTGSAPAVELAMLVARTHRWREASLYFGSPQEFHSILPFKPSSTHFPLLEDFSFEWPDFIDLIQNPIQNTILECRPPLQKLRLTQLSESYVDFIASRNLKAVDVHTYIGISLAKLLQMCPCLEFLGLKSFISTGKPDANEIPCQSSLLSSLLSLETRGDIANGVWKCVTLPKLTKLYVKLPSLLSWEEADRLHAHSTLRELKEVLMRSGCALQCVDLFPSVYTPGVPWPAALVTMLEQFFEGLPAKPEGCFLNHMPVQEWKKRYLEQRW